MAQTHTEKIGFKGLSGVQTAAMRILLGHPLARQSDMRYEVPGAQGWQKTQFADKLRG